MDDAAAIGRRAATRLAELLQSPGWPALTDAELDAAQERFGFTFAADHRAFLRAGVPAGGRWPDWRAADVPALRAPAEGVLFDVAANGFWYAGWGARPETGALELATRHLARAPVMVPVYGHRYLPAGRGTWGHPVLSIVQTDVICYGDNLADWVLQEFRGFTGVTVRPTVPFWGDLAA